MALSKCTINKIYIGERAGFTQQSQFASLFLSSELFMKPRSVQRDIIAPVGARQELRNERRRKRRSGV